MDNQLIDSIIAGLFDTPREQRTMAQVHSLMLFIAEAADIQLDAPATVQLEQLKLAAALRHLVKEYGAKDSTCSLRMEGEMEPYLTCSITILEATSPDDFDTRVHAIGYTAEEALVTIKNRLHALSRDILSAASRTRAAA